MTQDVRSRAWVFTAWDAQIEPMALWLSDNREGFTYACAALEVGTAEEEGKQHLQGVYRFRNARSWSAMKNALPEGVHFEAKGKHSTDFEWAAYVFDPHAMGKTEKEPGQIVFEIGRRPIEGAKNQWAYIIAAVENGASDYEIMMEWPEEFVKYQTAISRIRMTCLSTTLNEFHEVEVEYHWGRSGSGKTRGAIESVECPQDIYRVTDYKNPWDGYNGQPVILFEEFRSSFKIEETLNYLDGYRVQLPCRYANKVSGWNKVIICTNIPLEEQYVNIQSRQPETWNAVMRRITSVIHYE